MKRILMIIASLMALLLMSVMMVAWWYLDADDVAVPELAGYAGDGQQRVWPQSAPDDDTSIESTRWSVAGKPPVTLITIVGGGHTIPHPHFRLSRILGRTSHEFDATGLIWAFFSGAKYVPD